MNKKNMIISGITLGVVGGAAAFMMMNKNARRKATMMLEEAETFFKNEMN